jgi:hypothetical protein
VTGFRNAGCERNRDVLLDFADRREIRPGTAAALDHLGRCRACARELEVTALAIVGLRRLYDEVSRVEPAGDSWDRLRSRVTRPSRGAYGFASPILGAAVAWSLVAAIGLQVAVLPSLGADRAPLAVTVRDAFEPTVRILSYGLGPTAYSSVKPRILDGDTRGSRSAVADAHARHLSSA